MAVRRSYQEGCATAHALDVIGERWALLVVRELLFGPKRFTDLDARLAGASTSVLSQRLRELIDSGVISRRKLSPPAGSWVYELTDWGRELEPIIMALGLWGSRSVQFDGAAPITPAAMALALKGFAKPGKLDNLTGVVELQLDDETFHARSHGNELVVTGPTNTLPAVRIIAKPESLQPFLYGLAANPRNLKNNDIHIEGDYPAAVAFLALMAD
jgi:DNA-binding HxlR family transcriptional regulator